MSDIAFLPATELLKLYRERELSPVEATEAALRQIELYNPRVNAYVLVDAEQALAQARESEERYRTGKSRGRLDGVPASIKDLILTRGWPTLRGSRTIDPDQEWHEDAPVAARLREHGAARTRAAGRRAEGGMMADRGRPVPPAQRRCAAGS